MSEQKSDEIYIRKLDDTLDKLIAEYSNFLEAITNYQSFYPDSVAKNQTFEKQIEFFKRALPILEFFKSQTENTITLIARAKNNPNLLKEIFEKFQSSELNRGVDKINQAYQKLNVVSAYFKGVTDSKLIHSEPFKKACDALEEALFGVYQIIAEIANNFVLSAKDLPEKIDDLLTKSIDLQEDTLLAIEHLTKNYDQNYPLINTFSEMANKFKNGWGDFNEVTLPLSKGIIYALNLRDTRIENLKYLKDLIEKFTPKINSAEEALVKSQQNYPGALEAYNTFLESYKSILAREELKGFESKFFQREQKDKKESKESKKDPTPVTFAQSSMQTEAKAKKEEADAKASRGKKPQSS